jgi:endonuclease-3
VVPERRRGRGAGRDAAPVPRRLGGEAGGVRGGAEGRARGDAREGRGEIDAADALKAKALVVHERLCAAYGCPIPFFGDLDPLSELVSSLLSHRTKNADSARAFRTLVARFPTWEAVRDAPTPDVQAAISAATWPEQKAPRVQNVLRLIGERRGGEDLSLDFLAELPVPEARAWLESLPGVGPKTSAAVLLFSHLRRPALPVDSHHHRVAQRLGLIPANVDVGPAHALLEAQLPLDWDAQTVYDNHEALMLHGQRVCFFRSPACRTCVVLDLCPTGQARVGQPSLDV